MRRSDTVKWLKITRAKLKRRTAEKRVAVLFSLKSINLVSWLSTTITGVAKSHFLIWGHIWNPWICLLLCLTSFRWHFQPLFSIEKKRCPDNIWTYFVWIRNNQGLLSLAVTSVPECKKGRGHLSKKRNDCCKVKFGILKELLVTKRRSEMTILALKPQSYFRKQSHMQLCRSGILGGYGFVVSKWSGFFAF